jgi:hypothetical protein
MKYKISFYFPFKICLELFFGGWGAKLSHAVKSPYYKMKGTSRSIALVKRRKMAGEYTVMPERSPRRREN